MTSDSHLFKATKIVAMIFYTVFLILAGVLLSIPSTPREETPSGTPVYIIVEAPTPEPNVWLTCYSEGTLIFEGSAYDPGVFLNSPVDLSFGQVRWEDLDGKTYTFTNGQCKLVRE